MHYPLTYQLDYQHHVLIKFSLRAKHIQIKITGAQAHLIIPKSASYNKAIGFLQSKKNWLITKLAKNDLQHISSINSFIVERQGQIFGKIYSLIQQNSKTIEVSGNHIILNLEQKNAEHKLRAFFKLWLYQEIKAQVLAMTEILGVKHNNIVIKQMRTRWGSCNSNKQLTFNEKLIFTDYPIIKYLVAHEVSHLLEMNHSQNFWHIVAQLDPSWRNSRQWLKQYSSIILNS